jgi:hypothetical protein
MDKWSTKRQVKTNQELLQSSPIKINRGIFQGDSLPLLPFCIALIPLTHELNRYNCGYQIYGTEWKVCHLLFVCDQKLTGRSGEELTNEIRVVKTISSYLKLNLYYKSVPKCGKFYRKQHM